jgi:hypothetical protein
MKNTRKPGEKFNFFNNQKPVEKVVNLEGEEEKMN